MRPSWDEYWLAIAEKVGARADCTRRKAGAIIVVNQCIVAQGYNGAPPGEPGCLTESACPRGRHMPHQVVHATGWLANNNPIITETTRCKWDGKPWPCPDVVAGKSSYDSGPGMCIAVHAEANALLRASWSDMNAAAVMYMWPGAPCDGCKRLISATQIGRIVWPLEDGQVGEWTR
jgi:dCMP deaminase